MIKNYGTYLLRPIKRNLTIIDKRTEVDGQNMQIYLRNQFENLLYKINNGCGMSDCLIKRPKGMAPVSSCKCTLENFAECLFEILTAIESV